MPSHSIRAGFIDPMLLLNTDKLPEDTNWVYERKLDGYRAIGFKSQRHAHLRSRNGKNFKSRYPGITTALDDLPDETVIDGEIVALDQTGRPSFNALQNYGSSAGTVFFYVFDSFRQAIALERDVLPNLHDPIRHAPQCDASLADLISAVRQQRLEGLVAKRLDSIYEPGQRSGAWQKMRVNRGQEFVIGGYTPSARNFDTVILGYYDGDRLIYAARARNGFTPASRGQLFRRCKELETTECPFANLPESQGGRWGEGLTAAKMEECKWVKPVLVGHVEFVEWTPDGHLRHARFVGLREDKKPGDVRREDSSTPLVHR